MNQGGAIIVNYIDILKLLLIILVVIITAGISLLLIHDRDQQKKIMEGQELRRMNAFSVYAGESGGMFSYLQHIAGASLVKDEEWLKRKNTGTDPKSYKKEFKYISHLSCDYECAGLEKGM